MTMPASVFDFSAIRARLDQLGERQSFLPPADDAEAGADDLRDQLAQRAPIRELLRQKRRD
jgi:hypothetical protein